MSTKFPKISIVMPNLNGETYIAQAIESFLAQEYANKELIIVDGGSSDRSHEIIQHYDETHKNIVWVKKVDRSLSEAINIGLDHVQGDIVGYLGSDDILYRGILDEVAYNHSWSNFDAVFFNSYTHHIKEKRCILRKPSITRFSKKNLLRHGTLVGLQNIFFSRHVYDKYRYDPDNRWSCDYEFYLRISSEPYLYIYVDRIATINIFDGNISADPDGRQYLESCEVASRYASSSDRVYFSRRKYRIKKLKSRIRHVFRR